MKRTGSPDDRQKCGETSRPLGISDWDSRTIDVAELLPIDVTVSDGFEVRRRILDKIN